MVTKLGFLIGDAGFFFVWKKLITFQYVSVVKRYADAFLLQCLVNIDCCVKETAIYKASMFVQFWILPWLSCELNDE